MARRWTKEDEEYLEDNWGCVSMATMTKMLGRSRNAIIQRGYIRLGLGSAAGNNDRITLAEFCRLSGISRDRVNGSVFTAAGFPCKKKWVLNRQMYMVDLEAALVWLEEHQELFDASKMSQELFATEPDWLIQKRRADREKKQAVVGMANKKSWTTEEISTLKTRLQMGVSISELAQQFHVTEQQVKGAIYRHGLAYQTPRFWTASDFKFLKAHYQDMNNEELARKLGHSKSSVAMQKKMLGLYQDSVPPKERLTDEHKTYIRENLGKKTQKQIAADIGYHVNSVHRYVMKLKQEENNGTDL